MTGFETPPSGRPEPTEGYELEIVEIIKTREGFQVLGLREKNGDPNRTYRLRLSDLDEYGLSGPAGVDVLRDIHHEVKRIADNMTGKRAPRERR